MKKLVYLIGIASALNAMDITHEINHATLVHHFLLEMVPLKIKQSIIQVYSNTALNLSEVEIYAHSPTHHGSLHERWVDSHRITEDEWQTLARWGERVTKNLKNRPHYEPLTSFIFPLLRINTSTFDSEKILMLCGQNAIAEFDELRRSLEESAPPYADGADQQ